MSKRIANSKPRTKAAHYGRIRYGWRTIKLDSDLEKIDKALREDDLDEKLRTTYENFKDKAKQLLPKKLLRRHQGR